MDDNIRVLVIDDSQQIRDFLIEYVLEPQGFDIDIAVNGQEGLEKALRDPPPELILMDYEMPLMTGPQVLRALNAKGSKIPVILMTARGSEELAIEVFRLGVYNYVPKPFEPGEMLDAIEDALSLARLKRERDHLMRQLIRSNKELENRVNELNVMYQVGKTITALVNPGTVLQRLVEAVLFVVQADSCVLDLTDPETNDVVKQVRKRRTTDDVRPPGETKVYAVPLQIGEQPVGKLTVTKRVTGDFSSHENHLLRMLSDYAAIAIHNLHLMYQVQRTKEREKRQIRDLFERYMAPNLIEQMLSRPDLVKLGGTRETIAIMFADVRGFSSFSNKTSPESLVELLNQYMRVAADAVLFEEGTLDKFMGDAVMAFFNAPLPQSDYVMRAVRAAWALQKSVAQVHANLPEEFHLYFGIGVGVGEAVVGNIGAPQMMNFTVIGDAVNKVKRLQENAKGGQILVDSETYQLIEGRVRADCIGEIHLKGQATPEPLYEILGISQFEQFGEYVDRLSDLDQLMNYRLNV